jgi:chromo domain-containing protein 1
VLLAYSPKSSDFEFLNPESAHSRSPADVFLNVAVRSPLREFNTITARRERKRLHGESHKPVPLALTECPDVPSRARPTGAVATRPRPVGVPDVSAPEAVRPVKEISKLRIQIPTDSKVMTSNASEASDVTKQLDATNDSGSTNTSSVTPKISTQIPGAQNLQAASQNTPRESGHVNLAVQDSAQETASLLSASETPLPKQTITQPGTAPEADPGSPSTIQHDTSMTQAIADDVKSPSKPSIENTVDLDAFFREQFGVTYDLLASVNDSKKPTKAEVFYLMFPKESEVVQQEYELMYEYLKRHKAVTYSSRLPEDWERFARTIQKGVVLVSREDQKLIPTAALTK